MVYFHYVGLWQPIVLYIMKPRILAYPGDKCIGKEISSFYNNYMVWLVYQNMMALVEKLKHVAIVSKRIFFTSKVVLAQERKMFLVSFQITFSLLQQFEEQK